MKFKDYPYKEINVEEVGAKLKEMIAEFVNAKDAKTQIELIAKINAYRVEIETNFSIAHVRFTLDTNDEYYSKQNDILDEISPHYSAVVFEYYKVLLASEFKKEINEAYGDVLLKKAEASIRTFDPIIIEDMMEENKLTSQYSKLLSSAQIKFNDETLNLSQLGKYMEDSDRKVRKEASEAYYNWFNDNLEELDTIYDSLVKVRDKMAKKLGFKNYVELGYLNLGRVDYNAEDVAGYRKQVYEDVVPLSQQLFKKQAESLKIKDMHYYDYNLMFLDGNPKPAGDEDYLVDVASKMYKEMSKETDEFFAFMRDKELMDLDARKGKSGGGYCTTLPAYKAPFVFANFNGTRGDVDVLTHEMGHAFMAYECRNVPLLEQGWPTLEACEIHSMSMEYFAYPWLNDFFKEDEEKYKIAHINGSINFIPYGVAVDEFQHYVYENVEASPQERRAKWREIEKKYLPHINYGDNKFLNDGGRWLRQSHIFGSPFYYIDYTLAQASAFEFFNWWREEPTEAWKNYVHLCQLGGSKTYLNLLKEVKLSNPFEPGTLNKIITPLKTYLETLSF